MPRAGQAEGEVSGGYLDPDLLKGKDVSWWLEVQGVLTNGEMPPPDSDVKLADADRVKVIDWLAGKSARPRGAPGGRRPQHVSSNDAVRIQIRDAGSARVAA